MLICLSYVFCSCLILNMSFLGFFTGVNEKLETMESLVYRGLYRDALNVRLDVSLSTFFSLSNNDFNKYKYLEAVCYYQLRDYGYAQMAIVAILNNPSGAGKYAEKAKELKRKILEKENENSIVFPKETFRFFIEDCSTCIDFDERRVKEGVDDANYYEKIQIYEREDNKLLTFYWKPSSEGNELFIYLGDDFDKFCRKIDEKSIERNVYTKSLRNIGNLYFMGKNGVQLEPSIYITSDFAKPGVLNTYVLGIKTGKALSQIEDLENEITQLLKAFGGIMSDICQESSITDTIKILVAYFGQGVMDKVLTKGFDEVFKVAEVGKLISLIIKNK